MSEANSYDKDKKIMDFPKAVQEKNVPGSVSLLLLHFLRRALDAGPDAQRIAAEDLLDGSALPPRIFSMSSSE